jgi:hypothetical protein
VSAVLGFEVDHFIIEHPLDPSWVSEDEPVDELGA